MCATCDVYLGDLNGLGIKHSLCGVCHFYGPETATITVAVEDLHLNEENFGDTFANWLKLKYTYAKAHIAEIGDSPRKKSYIIVSELSRLRRRRPSSSALTL